MKKTKTGDSIHLTLGGIIEADLPERRTRVERRKVHVDFSEVGIKEDRRRGDRRGIADRREFERTEFPRLSVDPLRSLR